MRLLLDTNALLWWLADAPRLGESARRGIASAPEVLVSAVTGYEITFKCTIGKLEIPDDLGSQVVGYGFEQLPVTLVHAESAGRLPLHHRDPFDRLLIAQAECEGLTLVTADRQLAVYDVPILSACE